MSLQYEPEEGGPDTDETALSEVGAERPYYTIIFIIAIIVVGAVQLTSGLENSILSAGFVKPAFLEKHQYWRILTGATTHGSVMHVAMNCYAFYSFGRIMEMLANRAHVAIVFVLSAVGGGLLSLIFMPGGISVGASGGIVGLMGYLLIYSFRRRQFISPQFRKNLLINTGFILIFGIMLYQVIDNFGHVGGLMTGALYGLVQVPTDPQVDPRVAPANLELIGVAAVGTYVAACIFSVLLILRIV